MSDAARIENAQSLFIEGVIGDMDGVLIHDDAWGTDWRGTSSLL